ncbi:C-type lectin fold [Trinorchestia longiramus]|nr:C-type lectin fold [Trinorchestia longiramus]
MEVRGTSRSCYLRQQACAEHGGLAVLSNDPAYQAVITPQPPDKTCWVGLNQNEQGEWRFHDGILFEDSGISSSNFIGQDINKCTIVKKTNGLLSKQNCTSNMPCVLCTGN